MSSVSAHRDGRDEEGGRIRAVAHACEAASAGLRDVLRRNARTRVGDAEGVGAIRDHVRAALSGSGGAAPITYASLFGDEAYRPAAGEPTKAQLGREVADAGGRLVRAARRAMRAHGFDMRKVGDPTASRVASALVG